MISFFPPLLKRYGKLCSKRLTLSSLVVVVVSVTCCVQMYNEIREELIHDSRKEGIFELVKYEVL